MPQSVDGERVVENWDRVFDTLSAEPRRQVVVSLLDAAPDEPIELPDAAINPRIPVDRDRLMTHLYHRHLPALADEGFVEWDHDRNVARRGPDFEQAAAVFEALQANVDALPDALVEGCKQLEQCRDDGER